MLLIIKYTVLEVRSPFAQASTTRTVGKAQKLSEFILLVFKMYGIKSFFRNNLPENQQVLEKQMIEGN